MYLRVALAQLNTEAGDLPGCRADRTATSAEASGVDLCVFPEMHVTGHARGPALEAGLRGRQRGRAGGGRCGHGDDGAVEAFVAAATSSSAATLSATKPGFKSRSSGGYPVTVISGKTHRSAPDASADRRAVTIRSTLPGRSPTSVFSWASATRRYMARA